MPRIRARQHIGGAVGEQALGRLDADVLHRVGVEFRADETLDQIQYPLVGDNPEHRRPRPERRVPRHAGRQQAGVEVARVVASGLPVDVHQPLGESETGVGGSDLAAVVQLARQPVEHLFILGKQRFHHRPHLQHTLYRKTTIPSKPVELIQEISSGPHLKPHYDRGT